MSTIKLLQATEDSVVIGFFNMLSRENASESEIELFKLRKDNPQGKLVFDFAGLEYISSAGLRVILKCAKAEREKIKIINTNMEIYDILETTGFHRLFEIHKTMEQYSLKDLELIGQGANGAVYRIDRERIVKVFQKSTPMVDIERERSMAREALIAGLPTAISYSVVKVDDCYGIVFELIDSETLSRVMSSRPDDYDSLVDEYIRLYKLIHETKVTDAEFPSIKQIYYDAIDGCRDYYTAEEIDKLMALVNSVPDADTLIHGDYHPNNIMVQNGELILIDMGDMSRGHILFDFLATATTQYNLVNLNPEYAEYLVKMPVELIKKNWRRLIDVYFKEKTDQEKKRIEDQICKFTKLKVGLAPVFGRGAAPEIIQASIDDARVNLLPYIDDLIGAVDW
ncbi:MAG: phosphotransferase [Anaerovibrio sp.]|uniref:phosphotransferase n=1 Tax=Anaerovibrio sp. TaxID=1872532 RepID=UPI0025D61B3F|nr:phosphotransferase [Anaerovibrio sp.]MCR5175868.1 phosphotransferase [Anaerovibrio sp.]